MSDAAPSSRRKVIYLRRPSPVALEAAHEAALGGRGNALVRRGFVRRRDEAGGGPKPPLAHIMGFGERGAAGRGGEMRLKTYLTLHWLNSTRQESDAPAQDYADLLDAGFAVDVDASCEGEEVRLSDAVAITDAGGVREVLRRSGKQRVLRAMRWLSDHQFVVREVSPGRESVITLLSDLGDGSPFRRPDGGKGQDGEERPEDRYFAVPKGLWLHGWISALSGPALSVLLIYLDDWSPRASTGFIAGSRREQRYAISEPTLRRGSAELHAYGLATLQPRSRARFSTSRRSFTRYVLHRERLDCAVSPREDCPSEFRGFRIRDLGDRRHLEHST